MKFVHRNLPVKFFTPQIQT